MLGDKNKLYTVVNPKTGWVGVLAGNHMIRPNFMVAEFACSAGSGIILVNSQTLDRSEERRVGKACSEPWRNRRSTGHHQQTRDHR